MATEAERHRVNSARARGLLNARIVSCERRVAANEKAWETFRVGYMVAEKWQHVV